MFAGLTCRANQGHADNIGEIIQPVPGDRQRFFHLCGIVDKDSCNFSNVLRCVFRILFTVRKQFDTSGKSPAYRHHRKSSGARAERSAAGFFIGIFLLEFPNRTAAARHDATSPNAPSPGRRKRAAVRTFNCVPCVQLAGTRERAGPRRGIKPTAARGPTIGIRFAPEMIAPKPIMPHISFERFQAKACPGRDPEWIPVRVKKTRQDKKPEPPFRFNRNGGSMRERPMTAYLISLALVGLIAIAVSEGFS
jgi:hypothetical protein